VPKLKQDHSIIMSEYKQNMNMVRVSKFQISLSKANINERCLWSTTNLASLYYFHSIDSIYWGSLWWNCPWFLKALNSRETASLDCLLPKTKSWSLSRNTVSTSAYSLLVTSNEQNCLSYKVVTYSLCLEGIQNLLKMWLWDYSQPASAW
jgi:hypothetical protein